MPLRTDSAQVLRALSRYESRNVTHQSASGDWPIVWDRAKGVHVWDAEGRRYLDLTAAFGVAAAGHAHPDIVRAGQCQLRRLPHAMGDVHPHPLKAELCAQLSRITFERWTRAKSKGASSRGKVILGSSGFEAVEAALKTALLATGRPNIIAFEGGYHGLGYGALNATHRLHFRQRFRPQLGGFVEFAPFPDAHAATPPASANTASMKRGETSLDFLATRLKRGTIGAVLIEPLQARGGIRVPIPGFLPQLAQLCAEHGTLLIFDEIYTGFGRTGHGFACEHESVVPDLICLGKALAGGFPISACVGRADLMDAAWPESDGEAIHTSTFLGHPVGCAMALASIRVHRQLGLARRSRSTGQHLMEAMRRLASRFPQLGLVPRGRGLLAGLEARSAPPATVLGWVKSLLGQGLILLPEGEHGQVLSFTPPLTISPAQLNHALNLVERQLESSAGPGTSTGGRPQQSGLPERSGVRKISRRGLEAKACPSRSIASAAAAGETAA